MSAERVFARMAGWAFFAGAVAAGIAAALPRTPGTASAVLAVMAVLMLAVAGMVAWEYGPRQRAERRP